MLARAPKGGSSHIDFTEPPEASTEVTQSQSVPISQQIGEHGESATASTALPSSTEGVTPIANTLESRLHAGKETDIALNVSLFQLDAPAQPSPS